VKSKKVAFFDVDGTVINIKSMFSFMEFYWQYKDGNRSKDILQNFQQEMTNILENNGKREAVNQLYYQQFAGCNIQELNDVGEAWWHYIMTNTNHLFNDDILEKIIVHKNEDFEVVAVSGSMMPCLTPILRTINIKTALCTELGIDSNEKLTGKIINGPTIGEGKAKAIKKFIKNNPFFTLNGSAGYGDHYSDIPMLRLMDHPHAVKPCENLKTYAQQNNWAIIQ